VGAEEARNHFTRRPAVEEMGYQEAPKKLQDNSELPKGINQSDLLISPWGYQHVRQKCRRKSQRANVHEHVHGQLIEISIQLSNMSTYMLMHMQMCMSTGVTFLATERSRSNVRECE